MTDDLLDRGRGLIRHVECVAALRPQGSKAIQFGEIQVIIGIADGPRDVRHERHDIARRRLDIPCAVTCSNRQHARDLSGNQLL